MNKKKLKKKDKFGKKQVFFLPIDPYFQDCIVVINGHVSDAIKLLRKQKSANAKKTITFIDAHIKDYKDEDIGSGARLYTKLPCGYFMLVNHQDSWISTVGKVSHESTHLSQYVLHKAGLQLCKSSEEAFTYLQEYLLEQILLKMY